MAYFAKELYLPQGIPMPTRNFDLTPALDRFVTEKVEAGLYADANDLMRTALRRLEREEQEFDAKLSALRAAIDAGDRSEDAEDGVFESIETHIRELAKSQDGSIAQVIGVQKPLLLR